ncbi:GPP34 family phosphoprotein [Rhodococcus sp. NCIMB 12038]|uniref:GOLPH3/VPS74 family protein n=1 Tax=Rhodococcus sp. NCIMB 12038 TaxID=933800 RepID=UPI00211AED9C|nr:GPP34 family phosphoprotein [Rhodococcus sp. NCIMB 12038]
MVGTARGPRIRCSAGQTISSARSTHRHVQLIGTSKPLKPEAAIEKLTENLREELAARIVDAGCVREEKGKVLGIFPTTRWPEVDGSHERTVRNELSAALLDGVTPTPRTAALVSLLSSVVATVPVIVAGSR